MFSPPRRNCGSNGAGGYCQSGGNLAAAGRGRIRASPGISQSSARTAFGFTRTTPDFRHRRWRTTCYDSAIVSDPPLLPAVRVIPAPLSDLARELGHSLVKNVIALGVLARATGFFPRETVQQALRVTLHGSLLDVNERAFARGAADR